MFYRRALTAFAFFLIAAPAAAQAPAETPDLKLRGVSVKDGPKLDFRVGTARTGQGVVRAAAGSLPVGQHSRPVAPGVSRFQLPLRARTRARLRSGGPLLVDVVVRVHGADGAVIVAIQRTVLLRQRRGRVVAALLPVGASPLPPAPRLDKTRAAVGETVRCSGSGTFTWTRDGSPIDGASRSSYVLTLADVGRAVRCRADGVDSSNAVTAFNPGGTTGPRVESDDFRLRKVSVRPRPPAVVLVVGTRLPGKVSVNARSGSLGVGQVSRPVKPGVARVVLPLRRGARAVLRRGQSLTIALEIALHPRSGAVITLKRTITLRPSGA